MATQDSDLHEGSLPDLDPKIEVEDSDNYGSTENYETDIGVGPYNDEQDQIQENSIILSSLVVEGSAEDMLPEQTEGYTTADIDDQGQQFLAIAQNSGQISINDGENVVYADDFMNPIDEQYQKSNRPNVEDGELFYQPDSEEMDAEYLADSATLDETAAATEVLKDSSETMLQEIESVEPLPVTSAGAYISKPDLKNLVTIQTEQRGIKRVMPSTSKNIVAKVFVQNSANGPIIQKTPQTVSNVTGRRLSLAQAQRLGIIGPNSLQVLGNQGRVFVKRIAPVAKSPAKILPAPTPRARIVSAVTAPVRSTIPMAQVKTILTSTTAPSGPVTLARTFGGLTVAKMDGTSQKISLRPGSSGNGVAGQLRVTGNQHVKYLKLITNSPNAKTKIIHSPTSTMRTLAPAPVLIKADNTPKRIFLTADNDKITIPTLQLRKPKPVETIKLIGGRDDDDCVILEEEAGSVDLDPMDDLDKENEDGDGSINSQRLLEANGIRPKRPCNCTRSQCLKLYCECFANGEFCFRCNCINCYNNIEHEEERHLSIKSCLERNPAAFKPKIQVADSDEDERRHNKGCNCKRSYCLKNYCECYEAKLPCGKFCKCLSCRNTEDMVNLPPSDTVLDSGDEDRETPDKGAPFMPQPLAEALCQCILVQAEAAERKGEDVITTEQRIIEELGQRLVQIIGNRSKRDTR